MKILAICGSPRKGQTDKLVEMFEAVLKSYDDSIEIENIYLRDINLLPCKGCAVCLFKGEEYCPDKDDIPLIAEKMNNADGIIFATPNFSLQVSGLMKTFYDRFAYIFHRPRLFHKVAISIVTQGVYGAPAIVKYMNSVSDFWGLIISKGIPLSTPWGAKNPKTEWPKKEILKINKLLGKRAKDYYKALISERNPSPKLFKLILFRATRSSIKSSPDLLRDCEYYDKNGWFSASYYYNTKIGLFKSIIGFLMDKLISGQTKKNS